MDTVGTDRQSPERWHSQCINLQHLGGRPTIVSDEETEIMAQADQLAAEAQTTFFRITDNVPAEAQYRAALGSIAVSDMLKLSSKDDCSICIRQGPQRSSCSAPTIAWCGRVASRPGALSGRVLYTHRGGLGRFLRINPA